MEQFKHNVYDLMTLLHGIVESVEKDPKSKYDVQVVWMTTPPIR